MTGTTMTDKSTGTTMKVGLTLPIYSGTLADKTWGNIPRSTFGFKILDPILALLSMLSLSLASSKDKKGKHLS